MKSNIISKLKKDILKKGLDFTASKIVKNVCLDIKNKNKNVFLNVYLNKCLNNIKPKVVIKNKKISGTIYKVPKPYKDLTNNSLSLKWLTIFSKNRNDFKFSKKLSSEIIDSYNSTSSSFKKKKELHKSVLANRPNLKYL